MNKVKKSLNITIFGQKGIPKIELIDAYIKYKKFPDKKIKKDGLSFVKVFKDGTSLKLRFYEYSDIPDKKAKDISNHHCIIIIFDMTERKSFEDILDKWIKFLREIKYNNNNIILFGTKKDSNKNELPMTDIEEIDYLFQLIGIKKDFYDIGNKNENEICDLIDKLLEQSYGNAKSNMNKKDCLIF